MKMVDIGLVYLMIDATKLIASFLWEFFKGVAPVAVAIAAIIINNKRAREREHQSKKLEILLSWERNLFSKLEDFNTEIETGSTKAIVIVRDLCMGKTTIESAGDDITKVTNDLMRKGQGVIYLNESVQEKYGIKLKIPYFPHMIVDLANKIQDCFYVAVKEMDNLGENKTSKAIDSIINTAAEDIQNISGKVNYRVTMIMRDLAEKMLEMCDK